MLGRFHDHARHSGRIWTDYDEKVLMLHGMGHLISCLVRVEGGRTACVMDVQPSGSGRDKVSRGGT